MRLLLIRHGQTPGNVLGQLDTAHPGPGLTELGERQAAALARSLANEQIDLLFASTLIRTQITAAPLSTVRGLEIEVLEGLREIEAGSLEKLTDKESHLRYLGTVFGWAAGELHRRMPAGPSGHDFFERYDASITRIAAAAAAATRRRWPWSATAPQSASGRACGPATWRRTSPPATSSPTPGLWPWRGIPTPAGGSSTGTTVPWAAWRWWTRRRRTPPAARCN